VKRLPLVGVTTSKYSPLTGGTHCPPMSAWGRGVQGRAGACRGVPGVSTLARRTMCQHLALHWALMHGRRRGGKARDARGACGDAGARRRGRPPWARLRRSGAEPQWRATQAPLFDAARRATPRHGVLTPSAARCASRVRAADARPQRGAKRLRSARKQQQTPRRPRRDATHSCHSAQRTRTERRVRQAARTP
jgi:hypothetical protein